MLRNTGYLGGDMSFESLTASHKLAMTLDMLSPPSIGLPPNVWGVLSISIMSVLRPLTASLNLGVNSDGDIAELLSGCVTKTMATAQGNNILEENVVKSGSFVGISSEKRDVFQRPCRRGGTLVETL